MALPLPAENQPYVTVSALESGRIFHDNAMFIDNPPPGSSSYEWVPSLSFLLQHSLSKNKFLFDMGIWKDFKQSPPALLATIPPTFKVEIPQDVIESLAKGCLSPLDIDTVCLSHVHFDHTGYSAPFTNSQFVLGGQTMELFDTVGFWPSIPDSPFRDDLVPLKRTRFLEEDARWESVGPFPRAHDFYGDGSLYIIDAPGHILGHINILARTSADGGWIYLAGDTAHHWNLVTGESRIACNHSTGKAFFHHDKEMAEETIKRVQKVRENPRVRILLAHDTPWYAENKGGDAVGPLKRFEIDLFPFHHIDNMAKHGIDSLPDRLLSTILLQCLPIYTSPRGCAGPTWKNLRRQERDCLRLVSRRWNFLVTSTPQFWSLIDVELYHKYGSLRLKPSCFGIIALWLYRSANLPLDIILFIEDEGCNHLAMYQAMAEVLDLLWTSVHRWRTLKLNLSETSGLFWSVRSLAKARLLEAVHFSNSIPGCLIEPTIRGFGDLSALRAFSIDGLQVTASRAMIAHMPLHQLTRLDVLLHERSLADGLHVFRECVAVTWIRIDSLGDPGSVDVRKLGGLVKLPQLRVLELAGMRCHATRQLSGRSLYSDGFISHPGHSLRVFRASELLLNQLESFFDNPHLVQIPVVEVKLLSADANSPDQAREVLEECGVGKKMNGRHLAIRVTLIMSLPPPSADQPFCKVSALESGHLHCIDSLFIDNPSSPDDLKRFPTLSFLLQHSSSTKKLVFDLGLRKDWHNAPPALLSSIPPTFKLEVDQDVVESLAKGGVGALFPKSRFVVGGETRRIIDLVKVKEGGLWPPNEESVYSADSIPLDRTTFLGDDIPWESIGPFPKAYDFYGDGSVYIVDAPGHLSGHVNLLARTSNDGAWIYLAGDTAHHWNLIKGISAVACRHDGQAISHEDREVAEESIRRVGGGGEGGEG
ncbi:hypothetical protein NP233_g7038 [Leucocoprinus birnbaumii]|uniref:Metallo-beta-lactamase domain-containing protein n=1 Tax=Leucocoprinus birnbaumii TaxID=56174 RepID=A0AAD5VPZ1_9AGAR|nr:hypothetical protein NP233_g7038 [Leucocoprinus birnbaumii]